MNRYVNYSEWKSSSGCYSHVAVPLVAEIRLSFKNTGDAGDPSVSKRLSGKLGSANLTKNDEHPSSVFMQPLKAII